MEMLAARSLSCCFVSRGHGVAGSKGTFLNVMLTCLRVGFPQNPFCLALDLLIGEICCRAGGVRVLRLLGYNLLLFDLSIWRGKRFVAFGGTMLLFLQCRLRLTNSHCIPGSSYSRAASCAFRSAFFSAKVRSSVFSFFNSLRAFSYAA